jgi:hypothetical protein
MSFPLTTTTMWTPKRSGAKSANVKNYLGRRPATIDERPPSRYHDSYSSLDHDDDEKEVGEQIVCHVREYEYYMKNAAKVPPKTILRDDNTGAESIQDDSSLESLEGDERTHSGTHRGIQFHPSNSSSSTVQSEPNVDDERSHKDEEEQQEEEQFQRWANSINWNDNGDENDVLPDEDETADELTQLPQPEDISSRSLTTKTTATTKKHHPHLLDMADLDVDDFDMYLLSIQGDGTSISGNESIFTGSVYSSKSGKLSTAGTASTGVSSLSTVSTRSRRSGAAQRRRGGSFAEATAAAASPTTTVSPPPRRRRSKGVSGWADSMLLASQLNPMSEWVAQSGWSKPAAEQFSTASFRLNEDESFEGIWEEPTPFDEFKCIIEQ